MSLPPPLPYDRRQAEWERPKTWREWRRFYAQQIPVREQIADFIAWQKYFAAAEICFIENGLIDLQDPTTLRALEHVARELDRDPQLAATLWNLYRRGDLGTGPDWRNSIARAVQAWERIRTETAHG